MNASHGCTDAAFLSSLGGYELIPHIVRTLGEGRAVTVDEIAASAGRPAADVERFLRSESGTEWDDEGRLVGFGLTTRPTAHRFVIAGRTFYTWCASDTLLFTVILGQPASVESTCLSTGEAITIELTPDEIVSLSLAGSVVSQRHRPDLLADVRLQICNHGHFFASSAAASTWTDEHPDGHVLTVAEAFANARAACVELGWVATGATRG